MKWYAALLHVWGNNIQIDIKYRVCRKQPVQFETRISLIGFPVLVQDKKKPKKRKVPFIYRQHVRMPASRKPYQVVQRKINYNRICNKVSQIGIRKHRYPEAKSAGTRNERNNREGPKQRNWTALEATRTGEIDMERWGFRLNPQNLCKLSCTRTSIRKQEALRSQLVDLAQLSSSGGGGMKRTAD